MNRFFLLCSVAALGFGGCATTSTTASSPQSSATSFADTTSPEGKLFGEYLVGSYANEIDDVQVRSDYYSRAYARLETDVPLGRRALTSAIAAGDLKLATNLAKQVEEQDPTEPMARAFLGANAFSKGRHKTAEAYFETSTADLTAQILINLMRGWNDVSRGESERAKTIFTNIGGGGYFSLLGELQVANLEAANGNLDAAKDAYAKVEAASLSPIETALSKTRALYVAGDIDGALAYLETFTADNGPFETGPIRQYTDLLKTGQKIENNLTPRQQASRAITESAFGFFMRNRANDVAEVYLRVALMLDPEHDKATLWLASVLDEAGRRDEAQALFKSFPETSPYYVQARISEANIYFAADEDDKAIEVLNDLNADHTSFITREFLGRARFFRENYADALPIYDALIKSMSEADLKANVEPLYLRGICYERLKQWDKAVADFKRVLELKPDNADALNYLGYTWVDRNENLEEAFDMIRRAVALQPNSGAIVDSLGWAHYKLGEYEKARVQLEKAVELSPSSATIIDHLGDVYWKVGRFREAGYQWERALEFDPTDKERKNIEIKLKSGLDAVDVLQN